MNKVPSLYSTLSQFGWHEWLIQRALFPLAPPSMIVPSLS